MNRRPNILYIHSHDTGRCISPYGYAMPTPNLARLAQQGVLFRQAFNAAPTCSPSRASLLTGMCAHSNGMLGLAHRGFALNDYRQHLVHTLRGAGYHTALVGVQHVAREVATIGYDEVRVQHSLAGHVDPDASQVDQNAPAAQDVAAAAIDLLDGAPPQPFFLSVGFYETHREFLPGEFRYDAAFCRPPGNLPDTPATRADMADFMGSLCRLDQGIGAVLAAVERNGLAANTLVICTTDHGLPMPGMKCTLTDWGMGTLLIMRGPGGFGGGKALDALVSQLDLFPTICDLAGIDPPPWLQGVSLLPLVNGAVDGVREELFAEVNFHAAYEPQRAVRTARWKYIRRYDNRTRPVLPNIDDSLSKDVWLQCGGAVRPVAAEQLYDLLADPHEAHNLAQEPGMAPILTEMAGRLQRWMASTGDPLLRGPIVPPAGAVWNDPDGFSPGEPTLSTQA